MGKWSERSDFIMPLFKDSTKIFMVMTLSIVAADLLATQVGLFSSTIDFSICFGCLFVDMSFVPTWIIKWCGFSLIERYLGVGQEHSK